MIYCFVIVVFVFWGLFICFECLPGLWVRFCFDGVFGLFDYDVSLFMVVFTLFGLVVAWLFFCGFVWFGWVCGCCMCFGWWICLLV